MRFSANISTLFTEVAPLERLAAAARVGFAGVEMQFPYGLDVAELAAAREAAGVAFVLFNMPAGRFEAGERGIACLPDRRAEFASGVEAAVGVARALGCKRVNCLAGKVPAGMALEEGWAVLVENVRHGADVLAAAGMELVLEPLNRRDNPGFILGTMAEVAALIGAVGRPNVRLQFDVYHAVAAGEDWLDGLVLHGARIGHIQFSDFPGRGEPGTGGLDWARFFSAVEALDYEGWVGAEYWPSGTTVESLGWMAGR